MVLSDAEVDSSYTLTLAPKLALDRFSIEGQWKLVAILIKNDPLWGTSIITKRASTFATRFYTLAWSYARGDL